MNKILINKAIINQTQFMIKNNEEINGRLKFLKIDKKYLNNYKLKNNYSNEFLENPLVDLLVEFVNLNHEESSIYSFRDESRLVDIDNFKFEPVAINNGFTTTEQDNEIFDIFSINIQNFSNSRIYPKIKKQMHLFFLVPDEETDYYFELDEGTIEEI